jgi:hypothetical protein
LHPAPLAAPPWPTETEPIGGGFWTVALALLLTGDTPGAEIVTVQLRVEPSRL